MNNPLIFATSNAYKLREVRKILEGKFIVSGLESLPDLGEIPETRDTIEGNAIQKVEYIGQFTDQAVFAEDSGLIVPGLGGEPGVHSARYAGEQKSDKANIAKLLGELKKNSVDRQAHFKTVIAYRDQDGVISTFTGKVHGMITSEPKGDRGFGYDPVFRPDGYEQTFGQLGDEVKNTISHRRKAIDLFIAFLTQ